MLELRRSEGLGLAGVGFACVLFGAAVSAGLGPRIAELCVALCVAVAIFRRPALGALSIVVLFAALPRDTLFGFGIPVLSGALKVTDLLLVVTLAAWLAHGRSLRASRPVVLWTLALVGLAVVGVLTAHAAGTSTKLSLNELRPLLAYLLVLPIAADARLRDLRGGAYAFVAATVVLSLITIWQYLHGIGSQATYAGGDLRVDGTPFALPVVALLWIATLWASVPTGRARVLLGACAALDVAGSVLTFRRGGWVAGLVALAALTVLLPAHQRRRLLTGFALAAALIAVALPLAASGSGGTWLNGVSQRFTSVGAGGSDASARYRLTEWQHDLQAIRSHPLRGIGLGSGVVFADPRYTPGLGYGGVWSHVYIHDSYLWFAVKLGLGGLLALLGLLGATLVRGWRAYRTSLDERARGLLAAALASLACLLFMSLTDAHLNSVSVTPTIAALIGLVEVVRRRGALDA